MSITDFVLIAILVSDLLFAFIIVFFDTKNPADVWAWLLVLYFLPVLGFVLCICSARTIVKKNVSVEARCRCGSQAPYRTAHK